MNLEQSAREIGDAAIRESIEEGVSELSEPQRNLFKRIYPGKITSADLPVAQ